ncbi:hypothetical protein [Sorangium sp. So ce388]|uniref:hypothetical protein n=1 Tax=Sorangium sp. So ce388 TaxID=3133309 RepID=UPI003F5CB8D4
MYIGRSRRHDRATALSLLRRIAGVAQGMDELRASLAGELPGRVVDGMADSAVIDALADRIARGQMTLIFPWLEAPTIGAPAIELAPAELPAREGPRQERMPRIDGLRWSVQRASVGSTVQAIFQASGFAGGESATVRVLERTPGAVASEVASIAAAIEKPEGEMRVDWTPKGEAERSLACTEEPGEGPLEFAFDVEAGTAQSRGPSGPLYLTNTISLRIIDEQSGDPIEGKLGLRLRFADGAERDVESTDGAVEVEETLVGPLTVIVDPEGRADETHADNAQVQKGTLEIRHGYLTVAVDILADPAALSTQDRFVLRSEDGAYRQERTTKNDLIEGDDRLTLRFTGVHKGKRYTLEHIPEGIGPLSIFENVPVEQLLPTAGGEEED